jgi:hypothetical protein
VSPSAAQRKEFSLQFLRTARRAVAACAAIAALAPAAANAATQQQIADGVAAGAAWLRTQQDSSTGRITGFGGDYALSALAAAGVHPADVHGPGALDPSAQDFYATEWTGQTTPSSTAILFGFSAGIDVQRVSPSTNLVALLATAYNRTGELEGSFAAGATNLTAFSTLALVKAAAASRAVSCRRSRRRSRSTPPRPRSPGPRRRSPRRRTPASARR